MDPKEEIQRLRSKARVVKITCSRPVRSPNRALGDHLVSYDVEIEEGVSLDEARTIAALVGLEVDLAAHNNAQAGGVISMGMRDKAVRGVRNNYNALLARLLRLEPEPTESDDVTGEEE